MSLKFQAYGQNSHESIFLQLISTVQRALEVSVNIPGPGTPPPVRTTAVESKASTRWFLLKKSSLLDFHIDLGCKIFGFCLLLFCQNQRTQLCSICILFEKSAFIFQFLIDKILNSVKQNIIVNFIIKKLKNKHNSSKSIQTEQS